MLISSMKQSIILTQLFLLQFVIIVINTNFKKPEKRPAVLYDSEEIMYSLIIYGR